MNNEKKYPLSDYQMGMYIDLQTDPDITTYNIPFLFRLPKVVSIERLIEALKKVFKAHPTLFTRLNKVKGEILQVCDVNEELQIKQIVLKDSELDNYLKDFLKPFELYDSPLYKIEIITTDSNRYLLYDFNHLLYDGGSMVSFMQDLDRAYRGEEIEPESFLCSEYFEKRKNEQSNEELESLNRYYEKELANVEATEFPADYPTGANISEEEIVDIIIPKELTGDIRALGITPNQIFQAATSIVLQRVCRSNRITHLTIHHGRFSQDIAHSVGYFVKTLPFSLEIDANMKVFDFIKYVAKKQKDLYTHAEYPYIKISDKFGLNPGIYYSYQGIVNEEYSLAGEIMDLKFLPIKRQNITVLVHDKEKEYDLRIEFDRNMYSYNLAMGFGKAIKCAVISMLKNMSQKVSDVQIVENQEEIIKLAQGEQIKYDTSSNFINLFLEQVKRYPNNISIVDETSSLTYAELDEKSDILAHYLRGLNVKGDVFVGIMTPRIKEYMISVLGVWKAGGAYLPLDSEYPTDRLKYMLEDSRSQALITTREMLQSKVIEDSSFIVENTIFIDEFLSENINPKPKINYADQENLAYMIYTSGSTGKPKGVMIQHKSLLSFLIGIKHLYSLTEKDKICCHSSFSFDASVEDLYPILTVGGEMHILCPKLRFDMHALNDYINEKGITGGCYTTQFGVEFLTQFNPKVKYLTVGGEKMDRAPQCDCVVYNTYGPTEFTVDATIFQVENAKVYKNIPIGRPMPNSNGYILDLFGNLLPLEFAGELCMEGTQIAKGYWGREDLTKEKFINSKFNLHKKIYRTGDLARYASDKNLEYLGRIDNQIKLRGFRIELGEIESALANYPDILSSCVIVCKIGTVEHLCAYYTSSQAIDENDLKVTLARSLTEYMVPTIYIRLDSMPITPNGKINRKGLPAPKIERNSTFVAPINDVEKDLCEVFSNILKLDEVSTDDDFFEIGGTSLMAISALIKIENKGYTISYGDLFKLKTPKALANFILSDSNKEISNDFPIDNYDYTAINSLLGNQRQDFWSDFSLNELGNILLTGSTGYLGAHILKEIIDSTDSNVYCLLRPKKCVTIESRLKSLLMYYFGDTYDELFGKRIFLIEGDITDENLDNKISQNIDTIINCAALVKHYEAGNDMERINYEAVVNLANFALTKDSRLIHISTYSTAGVSIDNSLDKNVYYSETDLYIGQSHTIKYTWTKFLAERALLQMVVDKGLRAKIMRVGNLMGRASDGEFQANFRSNAFVNGLRSYKALGVFPLSRMTEKTEESPIDMVAKSIVLLSKTPDDIYVLEPYNTYEHDMGAIIYAMNKFGYKIDVVSDEEYTKRFSELLKDPERSKHLQGILHDSSSLSIRYIEADNDYTTRLLYRLGFKWNQIGNGYIINLLRMLETLGFFEE